MEKALQLSTRDNVIDFTMKRYAHIAQEFAKRMRTNALQAYAYLFTQVSEDESFQIKPYLDEAMLKEGFDEGYELTL